MKNALDRSLIVGDTASRKRAPETPKGTAVKRRRPRMKSEDTQATQKQIDDHPGIVNDLPEETDRPYGQRRLVHDAHRTQFSPGKPEVADYSYGLVELSYYDRGGGMTVGEVLALSSGYGWCLGLLFVLVLVVRLRL